MLQRAWQNVQSAGSYRFISDVDQTLIPRPVPEMIGQQETALSLALDGATVLPDRAYMDLRLVGAGHNDAVAMLRDAGAVVHHRERRAQAGRRRAEPVALRGQRADLPRRGGERRGDVAA